MNYSEESEEQKESNTFIEEPIRRKWGRKRAYFTAEEQKEGKRIKQKWFWDKRRDEFKQMRDRISELESDVQRLTE